MYKSILTIAVAAILLAGCNNREKKKEDQAKEMARREYTDESVEVTVMELKEGTFRRQLATNGKLRAARRSSLSFKTSGVIETINVVNGQRVRQGDILAELDRTEALSSLTSAQQSFEKAKIDLNDAIIGFGYEGIGDSIPERTMELARIRSGYNSAELSLAASQNSFDACVLRAPFAGKVANVTGNSYERSGSEFCTIIDDSRLIVDFSVLETELELIQAGNTVQVASFFEPDNYIDGNIISVNPLVDKNGQVLVQAQIANNGSFIDGMNVRILVEKEIPGKLVVPKSAVVLRDNLEVLFRYKNGKASWTYVHTLMDNSSEYVVTANTDRGADLSPGDMIITTGNMNIADGTSVRIKQ